MCRRIAAESNAIVISVLYRLAPQFKYPTALEDCFDALTWISENTTAITLNPQELIVMGDSAGGNLAASLCLMTRDRKQHLISKQVLLYPITDGTLNQPSIQLLSNAPVLTKEAIEFFVQCYARSNSDISQSYFSPLLAENLSDLPPALIIAAEYDVLHDQNLMYAHHLQAAKNQVKLIDYPSMIHGFMSFPPFCSQANNAFAEIAAYIKGTVA